MRELTTIRRGATLPVALLADYALFHLEADLRWIELTAARADELGRVIPPLVAEVPVDAEPTSGENAHA
jgi:hypothetical protein